MGKTAAVVALGMFDGVHMGHRMLLSEAVSLAKDLSASPVVYTFSNNPQSVFKESPPVLTLPEEKTELIESLGLSVEMEPFTLEVAHTSPEGFINLLMERYDLKGVVAGYNYRFGKGRAGDADYLTEAGKSRGFETRILPPVIFRGRPVSSTRIRQAILRGDIASANEMLSEPFFYSGTVQPRRHIGHSLGFPTANILPDGKILPPFGVYAAIAEVEGKSYNAVVNIGVRPTVDDSASPAVTVEAHLLDYSGPELYGRKMTVRMIAFVRPERKFPDKKALSEQIGKDAAAAAGILAGCSRTK